MINFMISDRAGWWSFGSGSEEPWICCCSQGNSVRGQVRGGALGLGIGWAREGRFSRAVVPVCAVNVSVCDVPM